MSTPECPECGWPNGPGCETCSYQTDCPDCGDTGCPTCRTNPRTAEEAEAAITDLAVMVGRNRPGSCAVCRGRMWDPSHGTCRHCGGTGFADIYRRAEKLWGVKAQLGMLQEEAAEVIVAVSHVLRSRTDDGLYFSHECGEKLAEEIADLEIMLEQFRTMSGLKHVVDRYRNEKLVRLANRIKKAEEK